LNFNKHISSFSLGKKKINIKKKLISNFGFIKAKEILKKTGPKIIYKCSQNENSLTLALECFKKLKLNKSDILEIKNLIFVTESPIKLFPGNGYIFASKTSLLKNINIIDINAGCTGFVDALKIANGFKGKTIIVCSETYSKHINKFNRAVSPLFSDGSSIFIFDKKIFKIVKYISGFEKNTYNDLFCDTYSHLEMKGAHVFNFTTSVVIPALTNFLNNNVNISKLYIHQASSLVVNRFHSTFSKIDMPTNIKKIGNTVSSTIPILIHNDLKNNKIQNKSYLALCSFGVGLGFNIMLIKYNGK